MSINHKLMRRIHSPCITKYARTTFPLNSCTLLQIQRYGYGILTLVQEMRKKEIIACTHVMSCLNKKIFFFHHDNDDPLQKGNRKRQKKCFYCFSFYFCNFPSSYDFFFLLSLCYYFFSLSHVEKASPLM